MTAVVLTNLTNSASILGTGSPAWGSTGSAGTTGGTQNHIAAGTQQRFYAALEKASTDGAAVSPPSAADAPDRNAVQSSAAADADQNAQDRARRALELESPTPVSKSAETGSLVLDGLAKLRGVFQDREAHLSAAMSKSGESFDKLLAVQVEVTDFTLLVDVTSKVTGQSMQALQTLLNGQ